ncbi:predicted protein [Arabidopsis lyrata subsp. lyrata]|uniref:Predicted protein n=1 Tax=Arabidopsis lyrata subsp. lyrata TaxID=81972 RepID=D7LC86_ARALL|nr:predicted protein [Arabidopsis lyrata subsp. lyrata]
MHMIKPPEQRHSRRHHRLLRSLGHQFSFGFFALCEKLRECKCDLDTDMTTNLYNVASHGPHVSQPHGS